MINYRGFWLVVINTNGSALTGSASYCSIRKQALINHLPVKLTAIRLIAVRETNVSWYHRDPIEDSPEFRRTSQHYRFKGGP